MTPTTFPSDDKTGKTSCQPPRATRRMTSSAEVLRSNAVYGRSFAMASPTRTSRRTSRISSSRCAGDSRQEPRCAW